MLTLRKPHLKKLLAIILATVLLVSFFSFSVFATETKTNLALNKSVAGWSFTGDANLIYPGLSSTVSEVENASLSRLTDGVKMRDEPHNTLEDNWVSSTWETEGASRSKWINLYRGVGREVIIDLGDIANINDIILHVAGGNYGIELPTSTSFLLSEDGVDYYLIDELTASEATDTVALISNVEGEHLNQYTLKVTGTNYNARYLKIKFDVAVHVFIDELEIFGTMGASETADPLPGDSEEHIPDINAYPTFEQSGGVSDIFLAYMGFAPQSSSSEVLVTHKTMDEFKSAIAYVDTSGVAQDWLFDAVTIIPHSVDKTGGASDTKQDWQDLLDHWFNYTVDGAAVNLPQLQPAITQAKQEITPTPENGLTQEEIDNHKVKIQISVPTRLDTMTNWGSLDETIVASKNENGEYVFTKGGAKSDISLANSADVPALETLSNRASVMYWYMREALNMWSSVEAQNPDVIFDGFYHYAESVVLSEDPLADETAKIFNALVDYIALEDGATKYYSYWIPFYQAEGFNKWKQFGFDYAIMQPNYVFQFTQEGQLDSAAELAKRYGLGIEMEYSLNLVDKSVEYLTKSSQSALGYGQAPQAWYLGTWDPHNMAVNDSARREYYDLAYLAVNDLEVKSAVKPLSGDNILKDASITVDMQNPSSTGETKLTLVNNAVGVLTDGLYAENWANISSDANSALLSFIQGDTVDLANTTYTITAKLNNVYNVSGISLDTYHIASWGISSPDSVKFETSMDGVEWSEYLVTSDYAVATPSAQTAAQRRDFVAVQENEVMAQYIRASFERAADNSKDPVVPYAYVAFDEFVATGDVAITPLSGENILANADISIDINNPSEMGDAKLAVVNELTDKLTDGLYADTWSVNGADKPMLSFEQRDTVDNANDGYSITANLNGTYDVTGMSLDFYHLASWGIGAPQNVTFEVSMDGITWSEYAVTSAYNKTQPALQEAASRYDFIARTEPTTAKYVRATFIRDINPANDASYGHVGFDEFVVTGNEIATPPEGENILANATFTLEMQNPTEAGQTKLASLQALLPKLADGIYADNWLINSEANPLIALALGDTVDSANDVYTLTADLNGTYDITGMSLDFYHLVSWGISATDSVKFEISQDAENWTLYDDTNSYSDVASLQAGAVRREIIAQTDLASPVTAKYIRAVYSRGIDPSKGTPYGHIAIDEFVATGTKVDVVETFSISGTITDADTSAALAATVELLQNGEVVDSVTANEDGTYSFANVAAGTYSVAVRMDGYNVATSDEIALTSANAENINIMLNPTEPEDIYVTGITMQNKVTTVGEEFELLAQVSPDNATNKTVVYSVEDAGTTGATISADNILNTKASGIAKIKASVINGAQDGSNFEVTFTIEVLAPTKYKITVVNGTAKNGKDEANYLKKMTITATVPEGYRFVEWQSDDGVEFEDINAITTTFLMPANDVTVTAVVVKDLTFTFMSENGVIDADSKYTVSSADGTAVPEFPEVTANVGYTFKGWSVNGQAVDTNTAYDSDTVFVAMFSENSEGSYSTTSDFRVPKFSFMTPNYNIVLELGEKITVGHSSTGFLRNTVLKKLSGDDNLTVSGMNYKHSWFNAKYTWDITATTFGNTTFASRMSSSSSLNYEKYTITVVKTHKLAFGDININVVQTEDGGVSFTIPQFVGDGEFTSNGNTYKAGDVITVTADMVFTAK